jgi:hypothetical protein
MQIFPRIGKCGNEGSWRRSRGRTKSGDGRSKGINVAREGHFPKAFARRPLPEHSSRSTLYKFLFSPLRFWSQHLRTLHWQGMIWDHASNWGEEDIRALVAYLRTLPPVGRQVPLARPPAPDDCTTYTFWVAKSTVPGCR